MEGATDEIVQQVGSLFEVIQREFTAAAAASPVWVRVEDPDARERLMRALAEHVRNRTNARVATAIDLNYPLGMQSARLQAVFARAQAQVDAAPCAHTSRAELDAAIAKENARTEQIM